MMDLKSTTFNASINVKKNTETNSNSSTNNESYGTNTLYNSAIDINQTAFMSFEDSGNNNSINSLSGNKNLSCFNVSTTSSSSSPIMNLNNASVMLSSTGTDKNNTNNGFNLKTTTQFIEAERSESKNNEQGKQEEVDPKSQLANKTIFKTNNPNLSIIEINDNSIKEQDIQNSVVVIESPSDDDNDNYNDLKQQQLQQHQKQQHNQDHLTKLIHSTNDINTSSNALPKILPSYYSTSEKKRKKGDAVVNTNPIPNSTNYISADKKKTIVGPINPENNACVCDGEPSTSSGRPLKIYDTLEEFEKNLPSTVTVLDTPFGSRVYLVGTAHFSEESQDDVSFVIRNVRPDIVMVELCPSRIPILKLDEKTLLEEAKNINLAKIRNVIQTHGYVNGIFFILLLQMSAQMAKDIGMAPGGEFRRAFEEVHKLPGCKLHLGDRPIRITLHRALRALSFWQTIKLVWHLTANKSITIEEIEECKQRDLLEKLMQELAGEFPAFSQVFVKERDLFLCHSLQLASLPQTFIGPDNVSRSRPVKVVGVVGIGHANGIAEMWGQVDPQKIPPILEIPPKSLTTRVCTYSIKYGLIALTLYGAVRIFKSRWIRL